MPVFLIYHLSASLIEYNIEGIVATIQGELYALVCTIQLTGETQILIIKKFITNAKGKYKTSCDKQWLPCHTNKVVRSKLVPRRNKVFDFGSHESKVEGRYLEHCDLFKPELGFSDN